MKIEERKDIEPQIESEPQTSRRPWWTYFLYAGSDVLGRAVTAGILASSKDGRRATRGVKVERRALKPGVDPEKITATTIIGERLLGSDGKELGRIAEVTMDLTAGAVSYLVLSTGGLLGFGDKFYAIPLEYLVFSAEEKVFYIDIDKEKLKSIPEIDKHNWPRKAEWLQQ
jgi:sporulation protein YlmC with PRC-barrel domain